MNKFSRAASFATSAVAVALLAACASPMQEQSSYPVSTYPSNTYPSNTYPAQGGAYGSQQQYVEYGRVTGVEVVRTQQQREVSPGGAIIGGIVGGVIGNPDRQGQRPRRCHGSRRGGWCSGRQRHWPPEQHAVGGLLPHHGAGGQRRHAHL